MGRATMHTKAAGSPACGVHILPARTNYQKVTKRTVVTPAAASKPYMHSLFVNWSTLNAELVVSSIRTQIGQKAVRAPLTLTKAVWTGYYIAILASCQFGNLPF